LLLLLLFFFLLLIIYERHYCYYFAVIIVSYFIMTVQANKEKVDLFQQQARLTFRAQATSSPETEIACQLVLICGAE